MDFEAWTHQGTDRERQKRLLAGYGVGFAGIGTLALLLSLSTSSIAEEPKEEDVREVQLATEPEPEPEPEPEVAPEPMLDKPRPAGPVLPKLRPPTEVPEEKPAEVDAKPDDNPYASGDPYQYGSGANGSAPRTQAVEVAPAPPPPKPVAAPRGPIRVTEGTTPPEPIDQPMPVYPSSAKSAGIQGTVVVKFVVTEAGMPTQVRAVKGPEELRAACEESVKGSRFKPAIREGQPVSVFRFKPCVFKLRT